MPSIARSNRRGSRNAYAARSPRHFTARYFASEERPRQLVCRRKRKQQRRRRRGRRANVRGSTCALCNVHGETETTVDRGGEGERALSPSLYLSLLPFHRAPLLFFFSSAALYPLRSPAPNVLHGPISSLSRLSIALPPPLPPSPLSRSFSGEISMDEDAGTKK